MLRLLASAPLAAGFRLDRGGGRSCARPGAGRAGRRPPPGRPFEPKFFTPHEWQTGARARRSRSSPRTNARAAPPMPGVPEFMDFMMLDQPTRQVGMRGGLAWLDVECQKRFDKTFVDCAASEQTAVLDDIAWPSRAVVKPGDTATSSATRHRVLQQLPRSDRSGLLDDAHGNRRSAVHGQSIGRTVDWLPGGSADQVRRQVFRCLMAGRMSPGISIFLSSFLVLFLEIAFFAGCRRTSACCRTSRTSSCSRVFSGSAWAACWRPHAVACFLVSADSSAGRRGGLFLSPRGERPHVRQHLFLERHRRRHRPGRELAAAAAAVRGRGGAVCRARAADGARDGAARGRCGPTTLNLAGSLAGVIVFALMSWLELPPTVWFAIAFAASLPFLLQRGRVAAIRGIGARRAGCALLAALARR